MTKLHRTRVKQLLRDCAFDPKAPPYNIVTDIGNKGYYMTRALELIHEARPMTGAQSYTLKEAIRMLILAVHENGEKGTGKSS